MDSFNRTNLQNIKNIFEEKTGVDLDMGRQHRHPIKSAMLIAAVLICSLTTTAFAVSLFSSLSGDDLSLSATYAGDGVVSIYIENRSDKKLSFQKQLKLMSILMNRFGNEWKIFIPTTRTKRFLPVVFTILRKKTAL